MEPKIGGWPGLESSEAPACMRAGASEDSSPGHPTHRIVVRQWLLDRLPRNRRRAATSATRETIARSSATAKGIIHRSRLV